MKNIIVIFVFLIVNIFDVYSQDYSELKKIKCLDSMPNTYEKIKDLDTLFILYYKSDLKKFEQNLVNIPGHYFNNYNFFNYQYFPLQIYDEINYKKFNFREPIIMYKKKSFISKNIRRTIDVHFLRKFAYEIYTDFYTRERITFIIDLDSKNKNKYKIVQVNRPRYIIE